MADQIANPADNADVEKDDQSSQDDLDSDPDHRSQVDDVNRSSDKDSETITLDALSQEELQYIAENSRYRNILSDLLTPYTGKNDSSFSSDSADNSGHVQVHKLASSTRQKGGADTSPITAERRALKRPSDRVLRSSPARKEARRQAKKRKLN